MRQLLIFILTCLFFSKSEAQTPYSHYLNHTCEWSLYGEYGDIGLGHNHYKYYINGDTVIGANAYFKLFKLGVDSNWFNNTLTVTTYNEYAAALREDYQQRFYAIYALQSTENLLFDFSSAGMFNSVNTEANYYCNNPPLTVVSTDQVFLGVHPLTRYKMSGWSNWVIEGIGSGGGLLETSSECFNIWGGAVLICFKKDSDVVIVNNHYPCTLSGSISTATCHANFCYSMSAFSGTGGGLMSLYNTSNTTLAGDSIVSAVITFGDGVPNYLQTSNFGSPVNHVYMSPGTYNVSVFITTATGCTGTVTHPVNATQSVNTCIPHCQAKFCYSMIDSLGGHLATFYNTSTISPQDTVSQTNWDFGDGSVLSYSGLSAVQSHVYMSPGTYVPSLTIVTGDNCINQYSANINVSQPANTCTPTCHAGFCYSISSLGNGGLMTLNNTSYTTLANDSVASAVINFGDGSPLYSQTSNFVFPVNHVYFSPGIYSVSVIITTASGCTSTVTHFVNSTQSLNDCIPKCLSKYCYSMVDSAGWGAATFYNASTLSQTGDSLVSATWHFGDGTDLYQASNFFAPVHHTYFSTQNNYTAYLIIQSAGCSSTKSDTIFHNTNTCITTAVNNINTETSCGQIYPTLIHTTATIACNHNALPATLLLYDATGRKVKEQRLINATSTLNRNGLRSGIYFYAIVVKHKVVKKGKLIFD